MSFTPNIIRTKADYEAALLAYEAFFDNEPAPQSHEVDQCKLLGRLLPKYEEQYFSVPQTDPIESLYFAMDRLGLEQADLDRWLGSRSRASEILNRRREMNLHYIRKISEAWRVPAEILIKPYQLRSA